MTTSRTGHVAVVVENVPLAQDTRLLKQLDDLVANGYQVSVVTMRDPDNGRYHEVPGVKLLEYPPPAEGSGMLSYAREYAVSFLWAAALLARLRLRGSVDVLQLCQPPDIYFPLAWMMRLTGTRIVVDQRDLMPELLAARYDRPPQFLMRMLRWLERRSRRVAHQTVTVNDYLRERIVHAGATPDRVSVVRNGPVLGRMRLARPLPSLRHPHKDLVCWVGKMGRQDRVDLFLDVAEHFVRKLGREDCKFVALGDGECFEELRDLARERGLDPWVFLPGWLSEAEVFEYLVSADLGIDTSSQAEVSPVKAMEYMAAGLPMVGFDLPETKRITEGAALLVPAGDVPALAEASARLLDDSRERERLGAVGRNRVEKELAWEHQAPVYLSVIRRGMHARRARDSVTA